MSLLQSSLDDIKTRFLDKKKLIQLDKQEGTISHIGENDVQPGNLLLSSNEKLHSSFEQEIFLFCPGGYGRTKLSNNFFEKKLGVVATTRNWKSVNALYEMASER